MSLFMNCIITNLLTPFRKFLENSILKVTVV